MAESPDVRTPNSKRRRMNVNTPPPGTPQSAINRAFKKYDNISQLELDELIAIINDTYTHSKSGWMDRFINKILQFKNVLEDEYVFLTGSAAIALLGIALNNPETKDLQEPNDLDIIFDSQTKSFMNFKKLIIGDCSYNIINPSTGADNIEFLLEPGCSRDNMFNSVDIILQDTSSIKKYVKLFGIFKILL